MKKRRRSGVDYKIIIVAAAAIALVIIGIAVGIAIGRRSPQPASDAAAFTVQDAPREIDSAAVKSEVSAASPAEPAEGIAIPGWGSITIAANTKDVTVAFTNPEANAGKYYLTFELRLKEGDELLYKSQLVPAGMTITDITLSHALPAGEYPAVVHVQPYKTDESLTATNNADMETTLIVE